MTWQLPAPLRNRLHDGGEDVDRADDAGFTVLEVLVSFTLFVLVSATATVAIFTSINTSHLSQQRGAAAGVAQSYIAQAAANAATAAVEDGSQASGTHNATVANEHFNVQRWITFSLPGETQCSRGSSFTVSVVVTQAQTNKFLARSDSVIAC